MCVRMRPAARQTKYGTRRRKTFKSCGSALEVYPMGSEQMDRQPLDLSEHVEAATSYQERLAAEMRATGIIDGRKLRGSGRNRQIG